MKPVFLNLLEFREHLTVKWEENLVTNFSYTYEMLRILTFYESTLRLFMEHLWSTELWFAITGLISEKMTGFMLYLIYIFNTFSKMLSYHPEAKQALSRTLPLLSIAIQSSSTTLIWNKI